MSIYIKGQILSQFKRTSIIALLLLFLISKLYSVNNDSVTYMLLGMSINHTDPIDYTGVNEKLARYEIEEIKGIQKNNDFMWALINRNTTIITSLHYNRGTTGSIRGSKVYYSRWSSTAKYGIHHQSNREIIAFPYVGIGLESLFIRTDINYGIKSGDVFFVEENRYAANIISLLYGVAYYRNFLHAFPPLSKNPLELVFGIDVGGRITLTNNPWSKNGKLLSKRTTVDPKISLSNFFIRANISLGFLLD